MRKGLISAFVVVHLAALISSVIPASHNPLKAVTNPYVTLLGQKQAWSMYANKNATERYFVAEGIGADGEHVWTSKDLHVEGFRPWTSPRMDVLHNKRRGTWVKPWLRHQCTQAPAEVVRLRGVVLLETVRPPEDWAQHGLDPVHRRIFKKSVVCP